MARDLSAHDQALANVNTESANWSAKVQDSDAKLAALQQAQQEFDDAVAAEATARQQYETAQTAYTQAYGAVPKENTLTP